MPKDCDERKNLEVEEVHVDYVSCTFVRLDVTINHIYLSAQDLPPQVVDQFCQLLDVDFLASDRNNSPSSSSPSIPSCFLADLVS